MSIQIPNAVFEDKNVQQIVGFCGDGKLKNHSKCSVEFQQHLSQQNESKLFEYANYCLDNGFEKSGLVLQDIINECGRRIGYNVQNGLYTGNKTDIGFDGIWQNGNEWMIVEVKTTDAYRINLDTIMEYSNKLHKTVTSDIKLSTLIVAGRKDTGDLEAQIRGSKHAWSIRLVSVDALMKLVFLNNELVDEDFNYKVNKILRPFEYTRVDEIINLIFETQIETEKTITGDESTARSGIGYQQKATPRFELEKRRIEIVDKFFEQHELSYQKLGRASFISENEELYVCSAISKKYETRSTPYWYALHEKPLTEMSKYTNGYYLFGCMDINKACALPLKFIKKTIVDLRTTDKDGHRYWHIDINVIDEKMVLKTSNNVDIDIEEYSFET